MENDYYFSKVFYEDLVKMHDNIMFFFAVHEEKSFILNW